MLPWSLRWWVTSSRVGEEDRKGVGRGTAATNASRGARSTPAGSVHRTVTPIATGTARGEENPRNDGQESPQSVATGIVGRGNRGSVGTANVRSGIVRNGNSDDPATVKGGKAGNENRGDAGTKRTRGAGAVGEGVAGAISPARRDVGS